MGEDSEATLVPTSGVAFKDQILVLRAYVVLSDFGNKPVHYKEIMEATGLARTQISGLNSFFSTLNFLEPEERAKYKPTEAVIRFFDPLLGREHFEELTPAIENSLLFSTIQNHILIHGEQTWEELVDFLLRKTHTTVSSRAERALEWLTLSNALSINSQPERHSKPKDTAIKPNHPFSNVRQLRDIILRCQDYIYWFDKYFSISGLEYTIDSMKESSVSLIKILTGMGDKVNERFRKNFSRFASELDVLGKSASLRVIVDEEILRDIHDRWIVTKGTSWNVPSVDAILIGQYAEIKDTEYRPPFDEWWDSALDLLDDWNLILKRTRKD